MGRIPIELQDYRMNQTYKQYLDQKRRLEESRKQREELQRERDEEFENFRTYLFLKGIEDPQYGGKKKKDKKKT